MTDITIPPKALEAAEKAILKEWTDMNSGADAARAACLAMLKAWPGMSQLAENDSASIREMACFILPLPENTND